LCGEKPQTDFLGYRHGTYTGLGTSKEIRPGQAKTISERAAKKKKEADKRYNEAKREWEYMSEDARKTTP
jgi:hypothetical protein